MTTSLGLVAFAVLLGTFGPRWLTQAAWPGRSPALGMVAWLALTASVFSSLTLAGLALAVHEIPAGSGLVGFLHACSIALAGHDASPLGGLLPTVGAGTTAVLLGRLGYFFGRGWLGSRRDRELHLDLLGLVARPHPEPDVWVIRHPLPAVYCLPGRRKRVVVTEAALAALSEEQLRQVLAHEREHIRARHHLLLLAADTLANALFNRLGSQAARRRLAELAEMHADDAAEPEHRNALASAVLVLAGGARPPGVLAVSGGSAVARVSRLFLPSEPVVGRERVGLISVVVVTLVLPVVLAMAPALTDALLTYCLDLI